MPTLTQDLKFALNAENCYRADTITSGNRRRVVFGNQTLDYKFNYVLGNASFIGTADNGQHFKIFIVKGHGIRLGVGSTFESADPAKSIILIPDMIQNVVTVIEHLEIALED